MRPPLPTIAALLLTSVLLASPAGAVVSEVTTPPASFTRVDEAVMVSTATFDAPTLIGDLEGDDTVTLTTTAGTLSLGSTDGIVVTSGTGDGDTTVSFTGTTAAANAALDGLVVTPPEGWAGGTTVTVTVSGSSDASGAWPVSINAPLEADAARAQLLAGVTQLHSATQPGFVVAYGPEAYDVVYYPAGPTLGPMAVMASWGAGRVVAMPDHQMANMSSFGDVSGPFYRNTLAWLADSDLVGVQSARVVTNDQGNADWLAAEGFVDVVVATEGSLAADLQGADVYVPAWLGTSEPAANHAAIGEFVRGGGGLFVVEYGVGYEWWWGGGVPAAQGNQLLRECGIGFPGGTSWLTDVLDATWAASGQVNLEDTIAALQDTAGFSAGDLDRAGVLFGRLPAALGDDDPIVKLLDQLFVDAVGDISPTPATPVSSAWEQGLLWRELALLEATPVAEVTAHRTADGVMGEVPADAPRVSLAVTVDPSWTRWHSTGAYAAPGELVTVTIPAELAAAGFVARISGNTDDIGGKGTWLRMPRIARAFVLDAAEVAIASPFGGPIYIDVGTASQELPAFEVVLDGVVEAPLFVMGVPGVVDTTDADWNAGIRDLPAPYAELVSAHAAISLPSQHVRQLSDASNVVAFWDSVVAHQDAVGAHGDLRTTPERMNVDVQISAGALHAGYPTQGPLSTAPILTNLESLLANGSWGWFHELGHEAQRRPDKSWGWDNPYTFDGAVEATVNIFTSYAYDQLLIPSRGGWSWTGSRVEVMKRALDALDGGTFASVGVGFKLASYLQLRDHWGWETFQDVLAGYNDDEAALLPAGVQEERDQWLLRWSEATGHDMAPFLRDTWLIDVSDEAAAATAGLPDWMPAVGGIEGRIQTLPGQPVTFDLAGAALSHDGVADIVDVTAPEQGAIDGNGDGTWTYTTPTGWQGLDSFQYAVVSSTGHVMESTIEVNVTSHGVLMESWYGLGGTAIADLTSAAAYPDSPDESRALETTEIPVDAHDSYGVRLRAFVTAPASGDYTFWISSDDNGELWLGDDHTPETAQMVAWVPGWSSSRQWDKFPEQQSAPVALVKGEVRYLEALMKEGGGGDNLAIAWATSPEGPPQVLATEVVRVYRADNADPIAADDEAATAIGTPVVVDVLANDSDPDGDPLFVVSAQSESGAAVEDLGDGTLTYEPVEGWEGIDTLTYTIGDGLGGSASAEVVVTVGDPDFVPPTTTIAPSPGLHPCAALVFTGTASDDGKGVAFVEVRVDDGSWAEAALEGDPGDATLGWSYTWAGPTHGSHTLSARTTDVAGLMDEPTSTGFDVDCEGPGLATASSVLLFADDTAGSPHTFDVDVAPGVTVEAWARGELCFGGGAACDAGLDEAVVCVGPDGDEEGAGGVVAVTGAGVVPVGSHGVFTVDADATVQLGIDGDLPDIECLSRWFEATVHVGEPGAGHLFPADGHYTTDPQTAFEWTTGADVTSVDLYVDGDLVEGAAGGDGGYTLSEGQALADGPHAWSLKLTDALSNSSTTAEWSFTVDTSGPAPVELSEPTDGDTVDQSEVELCWSEPTDEETPIADVSVVVDGDVWFTTGPGADCLTVKGLDEGEHCFEVRARNMLRLESEAGSAVCVTVAIPQPEQEPEAGPEPAVEEEEPVVEEPQSPEAMPESEADVADVWTAEVGTPGAEIIEEITAEIIEEIIEEIGEPDVGPVDSGSTDTGPTDTGPTDTGGAADTGSTDTGSPDSGVPSPSQPAGGCGGAPSPAPWFLALLCVVAVLRRRRTHRV